MSEAHLKKGAAVSAKTVPGKTYNSGRVAGVTQGQKGAWYSVKLDDGTVINTRAACIRPA